MHITIHGTPREIAMLVDAMRREEDPGCAAVDMFKIGEPRIEIEADSAEVRKD